MKSERKLGCTVAVLATALSACAVGGGSSARSVDSGSNEDITPLTEKYIDTDASMSAALGLIFGMPLIDDRLDYAYGDAEDWRYIIVPEDGKMSIVINLDNNAMSGGWNIFDNQGRTLHTQSFSDSQSYYEFKDYPVQTGIYYFKMYATSGASVYTIGTSFTPNPPMAIPEPEPVPEPVPEPIAPEPKPRTKSSAPKSEVKESKAPVASSGGTRKITATISLITPKGSDTFNLKLKGVGSDYGTKAGDIGIISGSSTKVKILRCLSTSCQAVATGSDIDERALKSASIVFTVKD